MKVAIISTQVFPVPPDGYGGLERQAYYQALALTKKGYSVTVFSPKGAISKGWKVMETGDPDLKNREKKAYDDYIRRELPNFDFIIDNSWLKHSMKEFDNVLGIMHGHLSVFSFPPHGIVAGVSQWEAMYLHEVLNLPNSNIDTWRPVPYVYNAVESPFRDSEKHEDYLLYMARFSPYKGALQFLYLCKRNHRKGILIGGDKMIEDPNYLKLVKDKAKEFNLDFRGEVPEKERNDLLEHADMLVSPLTDPYIEVFGMNLVEAMGVGTIPYATQKGATEEVIQDGGWTINNVAEMLSNPLPPIDGDIRKRAVERAKFFSIDKLGDTLDTIIKSVTDGLDKIKKMNGQSVNRSASRGPVDSLRNSINDSNIKIKVGKD